MKILLSAALLLFLAALCCACGKQPEATNGTTATPPAINQELDIQEILSRPSSENVVPDAYLYYMKKCSYEPFGLPDGKVKDFLLCIQFEYEVNNGGLEFYFINISGDLNETVFALEKINEADADALKEALQCFPDGHCPEDREERSALMDQFDDESFSLLEELDQVIWEQTLSEDYYAYIMANKEEFLAY